MHEWGEKDIVGIINWITEHYPSASLLVVRHSVGGQIVGLAENNDKNHGHAHYCSTERILGSLAVSYKILLGSP